MTDPQTPARFDARICTLGEGPLWHPERQQLFWFDILGQRLLTRTQGVGQGEGQEDGDQAARTWAFDQPVSAAGWCSQDQLLVASASALFTLDLTSGAQQEITPLEADSPITRSNDGRADPWGGFWIGTMGKALEPEAGAIYRYYRGELRRVFDRITISNAICFSPEGHWLYFTDTPKQQIWRQALRSADGWPAARPPELFVDLRREGLNPDGAVVDHAGYLWNAQWGASRVARYSPEGVFERAIAFPASQISCPAFGGADLTRLFVTSAAEGLPAAASPNGAAEQAQDGQVFVQDTGITGQREHQVQL